MNVAALVRGIATLSWLVAIGLIGLSVARAARGQPFKGATSLIIVSVIVALAATSIGSSIIFVQPTERGVVISALQGGVRPDALEPGLQFVVPFLESVIPYTITRQTYTMSIAPTEGQIAGDDSVDARTSDGQVVKVVASVIFSIDPGRVVATHIQWQGRYLDNLVRPKARGRVGLVAPIDFGDQRFDIGELAPLQPRERRLIKDLGQRDLKRRLLLDEDGGTLIERSKVECQHGRHVKYATPPCTA